MANAIAILEAAGNAYINSAVALVIDTEAVDDIVSVDFAVNDQAGGEVVGGLKAETTLVAGDDIRTVSERLVEAIAAQTENCLPRAAIHTSVAAHIFFEPKGQNEPKELPSWSHSVDITAAQITTPPP